MRKLRLLIEYDGTAYHGWQVQPNGVTIQELLEKSLTDITKTRTQVYGAGRTDAGVHAKGQVAHFMTESCMTPREFMKALNSCLPADIVILQVEEVDEQFHAQMSAVKKLYRYSILNRDFPSALNCRFAHYIAQPLDVEAMQEAAAVLVGRHDFTSFRGAGCSAKTSTRTITKCEVKRERDVIRIEVEGDGFLKHMVRNIAGTLIEIGKGRIQAAGMQAILDSRDRKNAGPTAPARGLCLEWIEYGEPGQNDPV